MSEGSANIAPEWDDDDLPEWTDDQFDRAQFSIGGVVIRPANGHADAPAPPAARRWAMRPSVR